jgi:hypothetical protein
LLVLSLSASWSKTKPEALLLWCNNPRATTTTPFSKQPPFCLAFISNFLPFFLPGDWLVYCFAFIWANEQ